MKKILNIFSVTGVVLLLMMVLCFFSSAFDESGKNDSLATANVVPVNEDIHGSISYYYDIDYYSFTLPNDGYIYLTASYTKSDETIYADILDSSGECIHRQGKKMLSQSFTFTKIGLSAGKYYVVFNSVNAAPVGDYTLNIHYTESNVWEIESNDKLSQGRNIVTNTTYNGTFRDCYDHDSFCVNVSKSGYYSVVFSTVKSDESAYINFYNCNGKQKDYVSFKCLDLPRTTKAIFLDAGENYIQVYISGDGLCYKEYSIQLIEVDSSNNEDKDSELTTKNDKNNANGSDKAADNEQSTTIADNENEDIITRNSSDNSGEYIYNNIFKYTIVNSQVTIVSYMGNDNDVIIPDTIEKMTVVALADELFIETAARIVTIPDTVVSIGEKALYYSSDETVKVICNPHSAAQQFAENNNIEYDYIDETNDEELQDVNNTKLIVIICASFAAASLLIAIVIIIIKRKHS